jgi:hypothetical protein
MSGKPKKLHVFIDEAGDTTFFGKGREDIIGKNGVSKSFTLGMLQVKESLEPLRRKIIKKALEIENSPYYASVPSVKKRVEKYGKFVFHAKDDIPEIRKEFYDFIIEQKFSLQAVVGRKIMSLFIKKHNSNGNEFYADLLSHLIKDKFRNKKLILNVSERGSSTSHINLELAVDKARHRARKKHHKHKSNIEYCEVVANVQPYYSDPILSLADYTLWVVQRIFEKGEVRFYDYISNKIKLVVDLYDYKDNTKPKWYNYYTPKNKLSEDNKIDPSNG